MYTPVVDESCTHHLSSKLLRKSSSLPTQQTTRCIPRKRSFQDLNELVAPAGFQLKDIDNYVLYFHLVFEDETKFLKNYNLINLMMIYICSFNTMTCYTTVTSAVCTR